jgi:DNA polymerase-3 subunit epsilon
MTPRDKAIEWARSVASDPMSVVLDCETLGVRPDAGLCDIAVVAMDGLPILNTLINPGRPIPAEASDVHGIRDEDVRNAPTFADVYPDLCAVLTGRRVVIYNRAFDAAVLDACCDRYELAAFGAASWECAMLAYSDFDGTRSTNWRRPGMKWHKLGEACDAMGGTPDGRPSRDGGRASDPAACAGDGRARDIECRGDAGADGLVGAGIRNTRDGINATSAEPETGVLHERPVGRMRPSRPPALCGSLDDRGS